MPVLNVISITVIGLFVLAAFSIIIVAYFCFNDNDPDMYWHDNFGGQGIPPCPHNGGKTLVNEWTACGCEKTNLHCDLCGTIVKEGECEC